MVEATAGIARSGLDQERPSRLGLSVEVVILIIRDGELSVLLKKRNRSPFEGRWELPGRCIQPDEDLDSAARRELAGVADRPGGAHLEQLCTYGQPGRDPRMRVVSVAYLSLLPAAAGGNCCWVPVGGLIPAAAADRHPMAFDHAGIVGDGVERARAKLEYTSLATSLCTEPFTLGDLRRVYEAVWGVPLDVGNFRRKVLCTPGLVEPVGHRAAPASGGRPAELYRRGPARALRPAMLRP